MRKSVSRVLEDPRYAQERHIPHLMNRAAAAMYTVFSDDFPDGVSVQMWRIVATLYEQGEQRQVDLSRLTFIDPSTISRAVSSLKRRGLVSRRRSSTSNREVGIGLTAKGREIVAQFIPITVEHERLLTSGLTPRELQTLRRCLRQIHSNMERLAGDGRKQRGRSPVE